MGETQASQEVGDTGTRAVVHRQWIRTVQGPHFHLVSQGLSKNLGAWRLAQLLVRLGLGG